MENKKNGFWRKLSNINLEDLKIGWNLVNKYVQNLIKIEVIVSL